MSSPAHIPRVQALTPAGPDAVTLTLEDGKAVTVTAVYGTALGPDGLLCTNCLSEKCDFYRLPPHLAWEACAYLGLYPEGVDRARVSELDAYLLTLPSVTDAHTDPDALTLALTAPDGRKGLQQFPHPVRARLELHEPGEPFTRFPLTLLVEQGQGEALYTFRVDHTPAGYAVLTVLGWGHHLPGEA